MSVHLDSTDWLGAMQNDLVAVGSGPRDMISVTLFCTLHESENTRTCQNCLRELHAKSVQFLHVSVFSDSSNVQKRATKSDTLGHCLSGCITCWNQPTQAHFKCHLKSGSGP